jgi:hypothetical protein
MRSTPYLPERQLDKATHKTKTSNARREYYWSGRIEAAPIMIAHLLDEELLDTIALLELCGKPARLAAAPSPGLGRVVGVGVFRRHRPALAAAATDEIAELETGTRDHRFYFPPKLRARLFLRAHLGSLDLQFQVLQFPEGHPFNFACHDIFRLAGSLAHRIQLNGLKDRKAQLRLENFFIARSL